jgi:hypothetical protein
MLIFQEKITELGFLYLTPITTFINTLFQIMNLIEINRDDFMWF